MGLSGAVRKPRSEPSAMTESPTTWPRAVDGSGDRGEESLPRTSPDVAEVVPARINLSPGWRAEGDPISVAEWDPIDLEASYDAERRRAQRGRGSSRSPDEPGNLPEVVDRQRRRGQTDAQLDDACAVDQERTVGRHAGPLTARPINLRRQCHLAEVVDIKSQDVSALVGACSPIRIARSSIAGSIGWSGAVRKG